MKKRMKRVTALAMASAMVFSLAACGNANEEGKTDSEGDKTLERTKICVALFSDSGKGVTATKNYLDALSEKFNTEFVFSSFSQDDEAENITKVQELAAAGVDGIIGTTDIGTEALLNECEAAGIYYAGYLCDFNDSYTTNKEAVFGNEYFLGTVSDGPCTENTMAGKWAFDSLLQYNEEHPDDQITHVSMTMFPEWAIPAHKVRLEQFVSEVEKYNETADTPIIVDPLDEETDVLEFTAMDSTYFSKHPDIQAIISFAGGSSFVYPTMVAAGKEDIKLFTFGYDGSEQENFGTKGTQTYQQTAGSPVEAIIYPVILLVQKLNGVEYPDQPESADRIDGPMLIINSDEDMEKIINSLGETGEVENAFISPDEVYELSIFGNEDATYEGLVDAVQGISYD